MNSGLTPLKLLLLMTKSISRREQKGEEARCEGGGDPSGGRDGDGVGPGDRGAAQPDPLPHKPARGDQRDDAQHAIQPVPG